MLESHVQMLQELAAHLPGNCRPRLTLATKTKMDHVIQLLKVFSMGCLTKQKRSLPEALLHAANLLFPGFGDKLPLRLATANIGGRAERIPLSLDIALMHLRQQIWSPDTILYCWADASPQAGREWLLSQQIEVKRASVV